MGTHLRVLSERFPMSTNMTGFRWFFKNHYILVLWMKALEGLIPQSSTFSVAAIFVFLAHFEQHQERSPTIARIKKLERSHCSHMVNKC